MLTALIAILCLIAVTAFAGLRWLIVHPLHSGRRALPPLDAEQIALAASLEAHVTAIASRPHNLHFPDALEAAARYIENTLATMGLMTRAQTFTCGSREVRNIEVVFEPPDADATTPTLVVGAHYDSPDDSPGANDNGTGVAALIEIVRIASARPTAVRLRFVFFVNEEQPWGKTPDMGSLRHALALRETGEPVIGMLALETLGHFSDRPGSQRFPFPFGLLYGNRGDFVAFVGMLSGRAFVHRAIREFRQVSAVPSIGGVAPRAIEGIDLSDHWAYDQAGFPAAMVTDTAPFRNPYYHQRFDLPATVDYPMLARITQGLGAMVDRLARSINA